MMLLLAKFIDDKRPEMISSEGPDSYLLEGVIISRRTEKKYSNYHMHVMMKMLIRLIFSGIDQFRRGSYLTGSQLVEHKAKDHHHIIRSIDTPPL